MINLINGSLGVIYMAGLLLNRRMKDKILNFIMDRPMGCSSPEIAGELGMNRVTLAKYLSSLNSEGIIKFKNVGMAKLWYYEKNPIHRAMLHDPDADNNKTIKLLLDSLGEGIVISDNELNVIWVNEKMEKLVGSAAKVKGKKRQKILRAGESSAEKVLETGKIQRMIMKHKGKVLRITASPVKDKAGEVVGVIEIIAMG
tara:strand:- start:3918 stop:4517 length:600 start_codon:yes stop_codon:yes gene_type:complete